MKKTLVSLFATLAIAVMAMASPGDRALPQASPSEPPTIAVKDLNPGLNGKEVTITFEVQNIHPIYEISGIVPKESFPPFGITPVLPDRSPRLTVLVRDDLADLMDRFGIKVPSNAWRGTVIQATGRIYVSSVPPNAPQQGPTYGFNIHDWKRFRIVSSPLLVEKP